jgi:biotin carboxylase
VADRAEAIARMRRALGMFVVEGIYTSIPFHQRLLQHPDFIAGRIDTGFLSRHGFLQKGTDTRQLDSNDLKFRSV